MSRLGVYEWERLEWPGFQKHLVSRTEQYDIIRQLSKAFKVSCPEIGPCFMRGARCGLAGKYIPSRKVIQVGVNCVLGVLLHEFAHHLAFETNREACVKRAHGKWFKRSLKRVYRAAGRYLPVTS